MSFEAALSRAFAEGVHGSPDELVAIGGKHRVDAAGFAARAIADGDYALWDTRGRDRNGESVMTAGSVHVVSAEGVPRFEAAKHGITGLLRGIDRIGSAAPRCFGGFAFEPGKLGGFAPFGDARFVLPRWCVAAGPEGAHVELVVRREELETPEILLREMTQRLAPESAGSEGTSLEVSSDGASEFLRSGGLAIGAVERGELEKVVVVRRARVEGRLSPTHVIARLALERETVRFALGIGSHAFVGATPELLVRTDGTNVRSEAVAGTVARRGDDSSETHALRSSDKEQREHAHVVRAVRAGLAEVGVELEAETAPGVRSLRHVHHLVTPVRGRAPGVHVLDLVARLHPTPAVSGTPKERARAWLAENEPFPRGWFAAPFGWVDAKGRGAFVVALRSALLDPWGADVFAGAGIVVGSRVDRELAETEAKLRAMRAALGLDPVARRASDPPELRGAL